MLHVLFTLDYEIHGNGDGCPGKLMVDTTDRMLRLFDDYGAKLTIMADVGEILKFKEYSEETGRDKFYYAAIVSQLRRAIENGHDVQLHLHSSYFNAVCKDSRWVQDWSEYNFAGLSLSRMDFMIRTGKVFLEKILSQVDPGYRCFVFRAANWSVSPSRNVVEALVRNGLQVDTSIFKYGQRNGIVSFDYSHAHSPMEPWRANDDDLCCYDSNGRIWEIPIYSERRSLGAFLTINRLYRAATSRLHPIREEDGISQVQGEMGNTRKRGFVNRVAGLWEKHPWKADFNQCSGRQLVRALERAARQHATNANVGLPFVLIGHSKLFTRLNESSLRPFLRYVSSQQSNFRFGTFGSVIHPDGSLRKVCN